MLFRSHGHHRAGILAVDLFALGAEAADDPDLRILEDRAIMIGGLLGLRVEPEARLDLGRGHFHGVLLSTSNGRLERDST